MTQFTKGTAAYLAYMSARVMQAQEQGNERMCLNCGIELARMLQQVQPAAPTLLVTLARQLAQRITDAGGAGEAVEVAAELLAQDAPHLVLGTAAELVSLLQPTSACKALERALDREGYMDPYGGEAPAEMLQAG
jgi:hypothetical protein